MINFLWWGWAVGTLGLFLGLLSNDMLWWQWERNYTCSQDETDLVKKNACAGYNPTYSNFALWWFVVDSAIWAKTANSVHSWIASQWINLPEDYKEERRHMKAEMMDKKDALLALFSF